MEDPAFINTELWSSIGLSLKFLWGFVGTVILFGFSMLLALAFLPSLAYSKHLPEAVLRIRPVFYGTAAIGLIGAILIMIQVNAEVRDVLAVLYNRYFF